MTTETTVSWLSQVSLVRNTLLVFRRVWFPPSLPTAVPTVLCSMFFVEDAYSRSGLEFLAGRNSVMSWCFRIPLILVEVIDWWWCWCVGGGEVDAEFALVVHL